MSIKTEAEFFETVEQAGELNADVNQKSNQVNSMKADLKKYMDENDIEQAQAGNYTATFYTSERTSMNEDKLVEIVQELIDNAATEEETERLSKLIEYKPQVNSTLLEDMIYNGELDKDLIQDAVVVSTSAGIRFAVAKK